MRDACLAILLWLILLGVIFFDFLRTKMKFNKRIRDALPVDSAPAPQHKPTEHAKAIDLEKMSNGVFVDPWSQERSEQWRRDMAANRRVEAWARRERDFEQVIEDIKAGRRK